MGAEVSFVVPHQLLSGEPAHALHKAAFNLPDVDGRVDGAAHVVQDVDLEHPALAGEGVNGDLGAGGAVGEIVKRPPGQGRLVVMNFGRAVKAVAPQLDAVCVSGFHHLVETAGGFWGHDLAAFKAHSARAAAVEPGYKGTQVVAHSGGGKLGGAAVQVGARGGGGGRGVGDFAGVAGGDQHPLKWNPQFIGHDLRHLGVQTLTHLGAAVVHLHAAVQVHMHQRPGLVEERGGERNAKLHRREGHTALDHRIDQIPSQNGLSPAFIVTCLL